MEVRPLKSYCALTLKVTRSPSVAACAGIKAAGNIKAPASTAAKIQWFLLRSIFTSSASLYHGGTAPQHRQKQKKIVVYKSRAKTNAFSQWRSNALSFPAFGAVFTLWQWLWGRDRATSPALFYPLPALVIRFLHHQSLRAFRPKERSGLL